MMTKEEDQPGKYYVEGSADVETPSDAKVAKDPSGKFIVDCAKAGEKPDATAWNVKGVITTIICGILIALSLVNHIYLIITWQSKRGCYLNTMNESDLAAPFIWQTTWALVLSSVLFVLFLVAYFRKGEAESWLFRCLYQVVLCWTIATMIGYSAVLVVFGGPETHKTNCYTLLDSVVEREQPNAVFWLVMDRIDNITSHYICAIVSFGIFYFQIIPYDISFPVAPIAALFLWFIIAMVHTYHGVIYDVAINIWWVGLMSVGMNVMLHVVILLLTKRFARSKMLRDDSERTDKTDEFNADDWVAEEDIIYEV